MCLFSALLSILRILQRGLQAWISIYPEDTGRTLQLHQKDSCQKYGE